MRFSPSFSTSRLRDGGDPYAVSLQFEEGCCKWRAVHTNARGYGSPEFTTQVQHLARVLWRWDNVMASSALRSALRFTVCMQTVNLKTRLHRRLSGHRQRSVGSCGGTRNLPRCGRAATNLCGSAIGRTAATLG